MRRALAGLCGAAVVSGLPGIAVAAPTAPLPTYADPPLETLMADPPPAARPRLWRELTAASDGAEIAADLVWAKRMGFGGLVLGGSPSPAAVAMLAREANRLGLELVVAPAVERAMVGDGTKQLVWTQATLAPGDAANAALPPAGTGDIAVFAYPKPAGDNEAVPLADVVNLTDKVRADGSLDWGGSDPGDTRVWQLLRLGYAGTGAATQVDPFDGAAVRRAIESRIAAYRAAAGGLVGQTGVQGLLIVAPEPGAANWTPRMAFQFKRLRGYDPLPWLPVLAGVTLGSRAESERFRADYRATLDQLAADEFSGMIAHVALQNDLRVYGGGGGDAPRHADVPLAIPPGNMADWRAVAAVAHLYGQNLAGAIVPPAAAGNSASPAAVQRDLDRAWVVGINRPLLGPAFDRHAPWAEMVRPIADSIARQALLLQSGSNVADIVYALGDGGAPALPPGFAFDAIGEHALTTALINDGGDLVSPGSARYRLLVLGPGARRMTFATLKRLAELVQGGATVLGDPPAANPSLAGEAGQYAAFVARLWPGSGDARVGMGRVIAGSDVTGALARIGQPPQVRLNDSGARIAFVQRHHADGESFLLANEGEREATFEAAFRVTGKAPELWHPDTGRAEPLSYRSEDQATVVPLTLAPGETANIVFARPAIAPALAIKKLVPVALASIAGPWRVSVGADQSGPARTLSMPALLPLDRAPDSRLRTFAGVVTYARTFAVPRGWKHGQPLWLDLGVVRDVAEVWVNGKLAGTGWRAPYRVEIGALSRKGANKLELRVATLPSGETGTGNGLSGPVILMGQGR